MTAECCADGAERTPAAWRRRQAQTLENIILDNEPRMSVRGPNGEKSGMFERRG